ncbi:MAG: DUF1553 domain-containing protein [Planctomycetota bacterium]|nr:MAG: DUF1553 domain-containing protein [Planctomycetota bacterium]REK28969.1 MAG: DUF1553 domain-containing protein [Planctomycetota bacterium]REK39597.1 MAG: DUF1553 domain-containing protein [Planctomycetota bacterium]
MRMRGRIAATVTLVCLRLTAVAAAGDDLLPADVSIETAVDHYRDAGMTEAGVEAAQIIDDDAWLRRIMLDLAGRVPTLRELEEFRSSDTVDKRAAVVDQLVQSPDFAFHLRNELDLQLLAKIREDGEWRSYLLAATRENRAWDRIFREVMLPEREKPDEKGAGAFLRERVKEIDDLTNDTASLFFGVNISCAKCHDHPLVADWLQDHYFGMTSFFKRTYRTKQGMLAERFEGDVKFTTVAGEEKPAAFMFLTGTAIEEPPREVSDEEKEKIQQAIQQAEKEDNADPPPLPEFSPRTELVRLAVEDAEQNFLARNMVNRTWARLMGRGLVHPLDQMHSENPASHPELLNWLARDFASHGYDLRRLIRGIVLSETYARDTRWTGESEPPADELFAVGIPRPLTPRQLALSLTISTSNPEQLPGLEKPEDWPQRRENLENQANGMASLIEIPEDGFQVSVEEALLFSNSQRIENDYLRDGGDKLVGNLKAIEDDRESIVTLFEAVLSRPPTEEEIAACTDYLAARPDRRVAGIQQLTWALLTTPEFRFNH